CQTRGQRTEPLPLRLFCVSCLVAVMLMLAANALAQSPPASSNAEKSVPGSASTNATNAPPAFAVSEVDANGLKKLLQRDATQAHPLLVNFWATWCEPCREEFPDLVKINAEYRARGLEFITISLDDATDIKTAVPKFLKEMRAEEMPSYLLNETEPETAINEVDPSWSGGLPATFLFDAQGKIVFKQMGRIKPAELRQAIEKAVTK
ncbi:MAG: TlpA disulfide reductase family protein, partial [Pyrinomonadaceae bacterium]